MPLRFFASVHSGSVRCGTSILLSLSHDHSFAHAQNGWFGVHSMPVEPCPLTMMVSAVLWPTAVTLRQRLRCVSTISPTRMSSMGLGPSTVMTSDPPTKHGLPPKTTSTLSTYGVQSTLVMSPRFGTSGQWYARTSDGNLSISQKATGSQGPPSSATETASIPLNKLIYLNFLFSMMSIILH